MPEVEMAVYYAERDQVGLFRRCVIDFLDGLVLLMGWVVAYGVLVMAGVSEGVGNGVLLGIIFATTLAYLVLCKRYGKTLGYLVFSVQVVSLKGERASIGALCFRSLFVFIGPGNTLLDLLWLGSDPHRQALRDKMSRTYVVRRFAWPAGNGHVRYVLVDLLGYPLLLAEVVREGGEKEGR